MVAVDEMNLRCRQVAAFGLSQHRFGQRVVEAVEVGLAGAAGQFVQPSGMVGGCSPGTKGRQGERRVETRLGHQFVPGELHQQPFVAVEVGLGVFVPQLELFAHLVVEIFQQLLAGAASWTR